MLSLRRALGLLAVLLVAAILQADNTADIPSAAQAFGDLNGDGKDDVLLRHSDGRWYYYPMNGRQHLTSGRGAAYITSNTDWQFAGIGDLNGDGKDDVLLRRTTDGRWYYYPMNGRQTLTDQRGAADIVSDPAWELAGIGDLNGDGKDDVLLRHNGDHRWLYYPMNGRQHISGERGTANLSTDPDWQFAGIGDLNGDGTDDVLLRHTDGRWYYYPMNGRQHLTSGRGAAYITSNTDWQFAGTGDLNGDGKDDVLLRRSTDGRWYYYPMNGRQTLTDQRGAADIVSDPAWQLAGIGDLNGDGKDDVLLRHNGDHRWLYYPMNGRQHISAERGTANLSTDTNWSIAAAGDSGSSGGTGGSGGTGDPVGNDDHSDTRSGATGLAPGGSVSGRIDPGNDVDYFIVQVSGSGTLTLYTTGSLDTRGELQNNSGARVAYNDDSNGLNFRIERSVSTGTYYVKVESYQTHTGDYTLYADFSSRGGDDNRAPVARQFRDLPLEFTMRVGEIEDGGEDVLRGTSLFSDPDDDTLLYTASSSNPDVVTAFVRNIDSDSFRVIIEAVAPGMATITLTATDPDHLTATLDLAKVTVEADKEEPDLVVEAPEVSDRTLSPGESFIFSATVRNRGSGRSDSTTLYYYRSSNPTISSSDTRVGTDSVPSLSASDSSPESVTLTAPSSAGTYYYGTCVDRVSGESNTGNNCSSSVRVTVEQGQRGIAARVTNNCGNTIHLRFFEDSGTINSSSTRWPENRNKVYVVSNGAANRFTLECTPGYKVCYGARNTRTNSYEGVDITGERGCEGCCRSCPTSGHSNWNIDTQCNSQSPADLVVESPTVNDSDRRLTPRQSFTFSATVRNRGGGRSNATTLRYYRSTNDVISERDTLVGTDSVPSLSASGSSFESIDLTAPSTAGGYYYGACVDSVSGENRTNNNCSSGVGVRVESEQPPEPPEPPVSNDLYRALAIEHWVSGCRTRVWRISGTYSNLADAQADALNWCTSRATAGCSLGNWWRNACGAIAHGDNCGYGWSGSERTRAQAERGALNQCNARTNNCRVIGYFCDL